MKTEDMRLTLIKSTIHTVSEVGIDRATTKLLAGSVGLNEVYIYRIFGGKEELFYETFTYIDKEFATHLLEYIIEMTQNTTNTKEKMHKIFLRIWDFALQDKERCSFFIRYYYSRYYKKECNIERERIYQNVITLLGKGLKDPSNATWLFNFILDVIFSVAVKVLREEIPDNNQTRQSMFLLIYTAMEPHLNK